MPYQQIRRPVGTVSGIQDGSDGSRLLEMFSSAAIIPQESTVPIILRGSPGYSASFSPNPGTNLKALFNIDSAIYGNHTFVFTDTHLYVLSEPTPGSNFVAGNIIFSVAFPDSYALSIQPDKPLRWASDGRYIVFITDSEVYAIDRERIAEHISGDTDNPVFPAVTAPIPTDHSDATSTEAWVDVVYADGYFVLAANGGELFSSELASIQFDQLAFARADVSPDGIVGMAFFKNQLWVFGTHSVERWQNKGLTDFPFLRDRSFAIDVGCYSKESILVNEISVHFLGNDLIYYALPGAAPQGISNDTVSTLIRRSVQNDSAHTFLSYAYTEEGHKFICIHMGDADYNYWVYDWSTGQWHERNATHTRYIVHAARVRDRTFVITAGEDGIRELSVENPDNLVGQDRYITMPIMQINQMRFRHYSLQFDIHYEGDPDDVVTLELNWSDDNKLTWKGESRVKTLQRGVRTKFNNLGQVDSQGRHYRLKISGANGEIAVFGAYIEAEILAD